MKARLERLGVTGVRASTFHSAALSQLRYFRPDAVGRILPSKALIVRQIANSLPAPYKFRAAGDLATEIEWAHNRRIPPERYLGLARRPRAADPARPDAPRLPAVRGAEARRGADGLRGPARARDRDLRRRAGGRRVPRALRRVHGRRVPGRQPAPADAARPVARRRATTSASSATTTSRSTGSRVRRPSTCSVAGAFPHARSFRLEENYRSTPQVLALANRLVPKLGGAEKVLRATRPDGPEPEVRPFATAEAEGAFLVERIRAAGCPLEEIAILCRTHARLADFEAVLHEAGIPSQGAALLAREAARRVLRALDAAAPAAGRRPGDRARARLAADARPTSSASARDAADRPRAARPARGGARRHRRGVPGGARARFGSGGEARRGVHLLTYHGAKGLEFEVVLLPRLEEKELPLEAGAHAGRRSPRSGGSSTSA